MEPNSVKMPINKANEQFYVFIDKTSKVTLFIVIEDTQKIKKGTGKQWCWDMHFQPWFQSEH